MPKMLRYTPEFKEQCVRVLFADIGPAVSRKAACERLGSRVNVKPVTFCAQTTTGTTSDR